MERRPLIGLTGRRKRMSEIVDTVESLHHLEGDLYFLDYARAVWAAGGMPVHLPSVVDFSEWTEYLDGIVLSGGADIEPVHYGAENTASDTEPQRDINEFALYRAAIDADVPVLGICRGFQVINVASGGTMHQHVPAHANYHEDPATPTHEVKIVPGSILYDLYGPEFKTNSLHHQTVDQVGAGIQITATAPDGTPEGLEVPGKPVLAMQWHPEMMGIDTTPFAWLVSQAQTRMK